MSAVRLRPVIVTALCFLVHNARDFAAYGARECADLLRDELLDLHAQLVESRMQVLNDRAELDAYRNRYGPLPNREASAPIARMTA
jgi:hypothetical protein